MKLFGERKAGREGRREEEQGKMEGGGGGKDLLLLNSGWKALATYLLHKNLLR